MLSSWTHSVEWCIVTIKDKIYISIFILTSSTRYIHIYTAMIYIHLLRLFKLVSMSLTFCFNCCHSVAVSRMPRLVEYGFPWESWMYWRIFTLGSPPCLRMLTNFLLPILMSVDSRTGGMVSCCCSFVVECSVVTLPGAFTVESLLSYAALLLCFILMWRFRLSSQVYVFEQ